jgi:electron transfer flavoprotein beta subunit
MKAKKKELVVRPVAELGVDVAPRLKVLKVTEPPKRAGGIKVETAADLVMKLKNEAGVL